MTKQIAKAEVTSFIKGFITEASPLNFPADASIDEQNFELNKDGSRQRRLGIDLEEGYDKLPTGFTASSFYDNGFSTFSWKGAAGNANNFFIVVQFGNRLDFFKGDVFSLSGSGFISSITISKFNTSTAYSYASTDGYLIITSGYSEIAVITYNSITGFSLTYSRITVRDLWGVEVIDSDYETDPLFRSSETPPQSQIYNFRNQSWAYPREKKGKDIEYDPIFLYQDYLKIFPSDGEIVWEGMFRDPSSGTERFSSKQMKEIFGAKTSSSKGFFIIDLMDRGTSRLERIQHLQNNTSIPLTYIVNSLPQDRTDGGISVVESFAGRIWYAGFNGEVIDGDARSPNLSNTLFFSKLVRSRADITKCYQEGDPAGRGTSDIVDTDGGFIRINGANNINKLINIGEVLIVIADNGVWVIKGGGEYGFTATNYSVIRLSNFGSESPYASVSTGDALFYWANNGIYAVSKDKFGEYQAQNITSGSIQSFFDEISEQTAKNIIGIYDDRQKQIKWLIRYTPSDNHIIELILDIQLSAFTKNKFICNTVDILGYVKTLGTAYTDSAESVIVDDVSVEVLGDTVIVNAEEGAPSLNTIKYLTAVDDVVNYSFCELNNNKFIDWEVVGDPSDAEAYLLTGYATANDPSIMKQAPYLTAYFIKTESGSEIVDGDLVPANQSSCKLQSQWEWANSSISKKWSPEAQIYRFKRPLLIDEDGEFDNGFTVTTSKNKIRGRGRVLSLLFKTEPKKDCNIIGWSFQMTGNNQ